MAIQTKSSRVAIKEESTQNTIVAPSGGTDFIPILDGYDVTCNFESLENNEIKASIGVSKSTKSFEAPSSTIPLYIKHSGVEGTSPNWGLLLESCLGTTTVNSTERLTTTASTASLVKLASGGSDFSRGMALLIKDPALTNGYQIRNVTSVATNDITIAQNLPSGPASGVGVGKCINYAVANSGHPFFTLWDYKANGGAVQTVGGCRVPSISMSMTAGQNIQGDFTVEGIEFYYNTLITTSSNYWIDFNEGGSELNCNVSAKAWKDPYELADAIADAMNSVATATITCTYSDSTNKFTIASGGATFGILWKTGTHGSDNTDTHIGTLIGFADAADDTGSTSYVADTAQSLAAPYTPTFDSVDVNVAKNNQVLFGTSTEVSCFSAQEISIEVSNEHQMLDSVCAASGRDGSLYTGRTVTVTLRAYLSAGQAKEFNRYRENDDVIFTYNFGQKSGGNWVPGTCCNIHMPNATITEFALADNNGLVSLDLTVQAYVGSSGAGEFYVNFL